MQWNEKTDKLVRYGSQECSSHKLPDTVQLLQGLLEAMDAGGKSQVLENQQTQGIPKIYFGIVLIADSPKG